MTGAAFAHTAESERRKYVAMWARHEYRVWSPGEDSAPRALAAFGPPPGSVYDFGCGEGYAVDTFKRAGFRSLGFDIVPLRPGVIEACLWELDPRFRPADHAFSADVLEHIPPERVGACLAGIARLTRRRAFLRIATGPDSLGRLIGETLHLTVRPGWWWQSIVAEHFDNPSLGTHEGFVEIVADARPARRDA